MLQIIGNIAPPSALTGFAGGSLEQGALGVFLNLILRILIFGGSIYALFNLAFAGYAFMSAGDEPKKMAGAWAKIWQTLMGLMFLAGCYVLGAIFGYIIFGNPNAILNPSIPTP